MSKYLARLNAIIQKKPLPDEVTKVTEGAFGTFGTDQGRHVSPVNLQPEAAINSQNIPIPLALLWQIFRDRRAFWIPKGGFA